MAGLVAATLSGVQSLVAGVTLALAWTAMIVVDSRRTTDAIGAARLPLAANVVGAVVGVLAGRGIAMALKPSGSVMLTAIVLATVIAAAAVTQSWRSRVSNWRRALSPGEAVAAASAMTGLAAELADRISSADYWREALSMTRIAIDGIREGISRCANDLETLAGHEDLAYHDHRARLATALKPSVVDLVPAVLRAEHAEWRTADRQAIYQAAEAKASELVHLWIEHVKDRGLLEPPPFARELYPRAPYLSPTDFLPAGAEDAIRSAVNSDPREVMWQLCRPGDLSIVDSDGPLPTVSFAPRDVQQVLADEVPAHMIWILPGKYAGLIRLVPVRSLVSSTVKSPTAGPQRNTSSGNAGDHPVLDGGDFSGGPGGPPPGMLPAFGGGAVPAPRRYLKGQCPESIRSGQAVQPARQHRRGARARRARSLSPSMCPQKAGTFFLSCTLRGCSCSVISTRPCMFRQTGIPGR